VLDLHLKVAGFSLILLGLSHTLFPSRFRWNEELERLSPLNRQIFLVHNFFIVLVVVMFGLLSLTYTGSLLAPSPLAAALLAGLTLFWLCRLYAQFFLYDAELWRGNRFNTGVHVLFSLTWLYYVMVYGCAFLHQLVRV
jgi:hypothetical protein